MTMKNLARVGHPLACAVADSMNHIVQNHGPCSVTSESEKGNRKSQSKTTPFCLTAFVEKTEAENFYSKIQF